MDYKPFGRRPIPPLGNTRLLWRNPAVGAVFTIVPGVVVTLNLLQQLQQGQATSGQVLFVAPLLLGAILGGWLFGQLGIWPGGGMIGSIIVAFVGAVILVWITRLLKKA